MASLLALCAAGQWDEVESKLESKAVPTKQIHKSSGDEGLTPLHYACLEEKARVVALLLGEGADPSSGDREGTTCLHIAASLPNPEIMKLILNNEAVLADPNQVDQRGSAPLHLAAEAADDAGATDALKCIQLLLQHGALATAKDSTGKTPVEMAGSQAAADALKGEPQKSGRGRSRARVVSTEGEKENRSSGSSKPKGSSGSRSRVQVTPEVVSLPEEATAGRRRRRPGDPEAASAPGIAAAQEEDGGRNRRRNRAAGRADGRQSSAISHQEGNQSSGRAAGRASVEELSLLLEEENARVERQLIEQLDAEESSQIAWDLVIELLPQEFTKGDAPLLTRRSRSRHPAVADPASGSAEMTRATLLHRVRMPEVGLRSKLVWHPQDHRAYLLIGSKLGRLAREAERLGLSMQLKPGIEARLQAMRKQARRAAAKTSDETDDEGGGSDVELKAAREGAREGGIPAYAPYRRRVHQLYQLAAHPRFFSCAQRTLLLRSILEAPLAMGGAELLLAKLECSHVVHRIFSLHDVDERRSLEERWTTGSSLALAPAPLTCLFNYFGPDFALYFAFLRLYSLWLWLPTILGLLLFIFQETEFAGTENVWQAIYALLLVVWSSGFLQHWTRKAETLKQQWAVREAKTSERTPDESSPKERPEFVSEVSASGFYTSDDYFVPIHPKAIPDGVAIPMAPQFTSSERTVRLVASWGVLLGCASFSIIVQLALLLARSILTKSMSDTVGAHVASGVVNALAIELMGSYFRPVNLALLRWQNHRTAAQYEWHAALQLFSLAFVNRFTSLIYLALVKPFGTLGSLSLFQQHRGVQLAVQESCVDRLGRPTIGCADEVATQLGALLVVSLIVRTSAHWLYEWIRSRERAAQPGGRVHSEAHMDAPSSAASEMYELVMSYTTVALFAAAFPPTAALALVNNALEARTDSYRFLRCTQRPSPSPESLIGTWWPILQVVSLLSIVLNTLFVCHSSESLPAWLGYRDGSQYSLMLVLEHILLALKLTIDLLIPDVPAAGIAQLAKQRRLLHMAEASKTPPPPPVTRIDAEDAAEATRAAESEAEHDVERSDSIHRPEKMSDIGLLRSFLPLPSESLEEAKRVSRFFKEASMSGRSMDSSGGGEKARKQQFKARKKLLKNVRWTPNHAFNRASSRPACTDVVCLIPLMLVWLTLIAVGVLGGRYGYPARLFYGVDYELNTCGIANSDPRPLRFAPTRAEEFPFAIHLPNARFAPGVEPAQQEVVLGQALTTGERDLSGDAYSWYEPGKSTRWLLYYASPATRYGVCVSQCPSPISVSAGAALDELICPYEKETPSLDDCLPAYRTVAIAGYCVPAYPESQTVYDAANITLNSTTLEKDLFDLRSDLLRGGDAQNNRYFDSTLGDLILSWPLLLGCSLLTTLFAAAWTYGGLFAPSALYVVGGFITTGCLIGLTHGFWTEGEYQAAAAVSTNMTLCDGCYDWPRANSLWLQATGWTLCGLTVLITGAYMALSALVMEALPVMQVMGSLLMMAPSAWIAPALSVVAQLGFTALWMLGAAFLSSSGELEVNEYGYAFPRYASGVKALMVLHILFGLWTIAFLRNMGLIGAAGPLGRAYWRAAEAGRERVGRTEMHTLLAPLLHVGSAAYGASVCTVVAPLLFACQLFGVHSFDFLDETGFIPTAIFGTSLHAGAQWSSSIVRRYTPRMLTLRARAGLWLAATKLLWALVSAGVTTGVLLGQPAYDKPYPFGSDVGVSSIYWPVIVTFLISYILNSTVVSLLELSFSAAVTSWCLDYKQNVDDQPVEGSTWMMAVNEDPSLVSIHQLLCDEFAYHAALQTARERTRPYEPATSEAKKYAQSAVARKADSVAVGIADAPVQLGPQEEDEYEDYDEELGEPIRASPIQVAADEGGRRRRPPKV